MEEELKLAEPPKDETLPRIDAELINRFKASLIDPKTRRQLCGLISKTPTFSSCSEEFLSSLCDAMVPVAYKANEKLWHMGDAGSWMALLISGKTRRSMLRDRSGHEVVIGDDVAGRIAGDLALFGLSQKRPFTLRAVSDVTVLVLSRSKFNACVERAGGLSCMPFLEDVVRWRSFVGDLEPFMTLKCFQGLDREFLLALREHIEPRLMYPDEFLMRENAHGNEMFVLRAGKVKIQQGSKTILELGKKDDAHQGIVLGELAVLGTDKRRMASVITNSLCYVCVLHGDDFHGLLAKHPSARRVFDHRYIARLVSINIRQVAGERSNFDSFYGSCAPKTAVQLKALLGNVPEDMFAQPLSPKTARSAGGGGACALPPISPMSPTSPRRHAPV
eukprot:TRINITY_DN23443_c0_g1_i1.p1 TRINITY_DN23443_c0_g1~~TRINITY_DN23443_c0_g1_i1.p1  ORF type:complete len:390 (+),score=94.17 TRINITY_DN23443_c0_g1_i1:144-1313(+)